MYHPDVHSWPGGRRVIFVLNFLYVGGVAWAFANALPALLITVVMVAVVRKCLI